MNRCKLTWGVKLRRRNTRVALLVLEISLWL